MDDMYSRTRLVLGNDNVEKIKKLRICICGVGGVGSFVFESLVRIGVGNILIIDKDVIDVTNINRQLIATNDNIGKNKVEIAINRAKTINKDIVINGIKENITNGNIETLFKDKEIDYIIDCVDSVEAKIAIIDYCYKNKIKCISCMGMGNKLNPLDIKIADSYKTEVCPLAKIMRKRLKELGIKKQKVVYSVENPIKNNENKIGSVSFVPSVAGLVIASEVIKDSIK